MKSICYHPADIAEFKQKALKWATSFEVACYFDSNGYPDRYSSFDLFIAVDSVHEVCTQTGQAFTKLQNFLKRHHAWIPGFLTYDLKNELEDLYSENPDSLDFPDLYFFVPRHILLFKGKQVEIISDIPGLSSLIEEESSANPSLMPFGGSIKTRFSREEYIETVRQIKAHIARGDIYEANFCQEFYSENARINPLSTFLVLNRLSPSPFASFFKYKNHFILSASPERFLCRRGGKLISQPIKGTARRSPDPDEDLKLKNNLREDKKEQSENVMIVDLVRNDLTKCARPGTVEVEELFGLYTFSQVHQMISTVVCEAAPNLDNTDIISSAFPMGSMTGAPKVKAMQLIEKYERSRRGVFSGSVGYFTPDGDFDLNVIIRTLLYNSGTGYLSFQTGSAITFDSDPEKEYEECLLKAKAIFEALGVHVEKRP